MNDEKRQVFNYFAKENPDIISKENTVTAIRYLGIIQSQNDFSLLLKDYGDEITFDQFSEIVEKAKNNQINVNDLEKAFELFDHDKNKQINIKELFRVLSVSGEKLDEDDLKLFMDYAKINEGTQKASYKAIIDNMMAELKSS